MVYDFLLHQMMSFLATQDYLIPNHKHFVKYIFYFIFLPFHVILFKAGSHHLFRSCQSKNWKVFLLICTIKIICRQVFAKLLSFQLYLPQQFLKSKIVKFHLMWANQKIFEFVFKEQGSEMGPQLFMKYYQVFSKIFSMSNSLAQCWN